MEDADSAMDEDNAQNQNIKEQVEAFPQEHVTIEHLLHGIQKHFAIFLLKLAEKHLLTRKVQEEIARDTKYLIQFIMDNFSEIIKFHLNEKGFIVDDHNDLNELLSDNELFTRGLESLHSTCTPNSVATTLI